MDDKEDLGVLLSGQFVGPDECAGLCAEMRAAARYPATVFKGSGRIFMCASEAVPLLAAAIGAIASLR